MEPSSMIDDVEFWLPPEFLTDDDCLLPYDPRRGFGAFGSTVKHNAMKEGVEDDFLAGLTRQMVQSSLEDDISGGFCGRRAFSVCNYNKAWGLNRSSPCVAGAGCTCRSQRSNQNSQSRVSSQARWDLYCAAVEEVARMSINNKPYHQSRGPFSAAASAKDVTGYYNHRQYLSYQKLQALQKLKQQQLMNHQSRGVRLGPIDLSFSAWSNQLHHRDVTRSLFIGDHTGKRGSTGTGVFLPRSVNHNTREKPSNADVSRRQRNNNGGYSSQTHGSKSEQSMKELRLPSDWAY